MKGKTTDTIQSIEQKILVEYEILKDPNVGKERKKKATKNLKNYEQHLRNVDDKYLNGKHYPERMKGFPDNEPMDKKELFKLIDSVPDEQHRNWEGLDTQDYDQEIDLSGVSVGKNIFEYVDKGWSKPKEMKPAPFFK